MKNKLFKYISFFAALVMIMGACEKSDIDKANEEYDFSMIVPVVQGINGPSTVTQTLTYAYSVNYYRGGSTWSWTGDGCTVSPVSDDGHDIEVTFPNDGDVSLTVTETTMAGKTSDPYVFDIFVETFCPYPWDEWEGTYTGTSDAHADDVVFTRTENLNEFTIEGLGDYPILYWGENWTSGDGSCVGTFYCGDTLIIPRQVVGETDYPDTYEVEGGAKVDPVTKDITLEWIVYYSTGDIGWQQTVLSQTKKGYATRSSSAVIPKQK